MYRSKSRARIQDPSLGSAKHTVVMGAACQIHSLTTPHQDHNPPPSPGWWHQYHCNENYLARAGCHGLLLADSVPIIVGLCKTFLAQNRPNWTKTGVTQKRAIWTGPTPKRSQRRGLQTPRWQNSGSQIFGPKKKTHFWILIMFRPRPGGVVKRKKYPFPK